MNTATKRIQVYEGKNKNGKDCWMMVICNERVIACEYLKKKYNFESTGVIKSVGFETDVIDWPPDDFEDIVGIAWRPL